MPFIIGALVIVLVGVGYYVWTQYAPKAEVTPQTVVQNTPQEPSVNTYASSTMGIAIEYPTAFMLQDPYAYTGFEGKPINGVKLNIPAEVTQGTNLAADSGISIEQLPRARACTGDIYIKANVKPTRISDGNATYSVATSTETASENTYEEMVFAIESSSPCTAIRYFIHSSEIANFATGTRAFDRAALVAAFDTIRRSLVVQSAAPAAPTAPSATSSSTQ